MKRDVLIGCLLVLASGCGSPRRSEPFAGPFDGDRAEARGRMLFEQHCSKCHPGGEAGLGPSLNEKPLPVFLMKLQVRKGLGAMPSFDERELGDRELSDLMDFVVAYRRHG